VPEKERQEGEGDGDVQEEEGAVKVGANGREGVRAEEEEGY
jgi:hypothetical protein